MVVLAVLLPLVMLGFVLALGRYEDLMLRPPSDHVPLPQGGSTPAERAPAGDVPSGCEH